MSKFEGSQQGITWSTVNQGDCSACGLCIASDHGTRIRGWGLQRQHGARELGLLRRVLSFEIGGAPSHIVRPTHLALR